MAWKDLNVKDRAQFIRQLVSLGITKSEEQADFYNNSLNSSQGHRFDGDPTPDEIKGTSTDAAYRRDKRTFSFNPYFNTTTGFSLSRYPNRWQEQKNVPMSYNLSVDIPVFKKARVRDPNEVHDDYYGSIALSANDEYKNGLSWALNTGYTRGGTRADDMLYANGQVGYHHPKTGLFGNLKLAYNKTENPLTLRGQNIIGEVGWKRTIGERKAEEIKRKETLLKEIEEERKKLEEKNENKKANGGHLYGGNPSLGRVLSDKYGDYDMDAYNRSGMSQGENGHYPDDFKKPWHITYPSGKWIEPSLVEQQWTGNNQPIFVPSTQNYMYYTPEDYFNYPHDKTLTQKFIPTGWNRHLTF